MIRTRNRADAAVALEQGVDLLDDGLGADTAQQCDGDVVERVFEVECRFERFPAHPDHAEALVVGQQ